jgi:hypothetical protein
MNSRAKHFRPVLTGLLCGVVWTSAVAARPVPRTNLASSPVSSKASPQSAAGASEVADASAGPTITFRKVFKSSYPEFVEIKLDQGGSGTYDIRQLSDAASPQTFRIGAPLAQKIFDLAGRLHDFAGINLEVRRRIANLGEKTLAYQNGADSHQVSFNYTTDPNASQLVTIFEGLTRQVSDISDLQRTMRYDRLGVNDVILQIEADYNTKQLPEPQQFLDLLDQVAADTKIIDIARNRAQALAARIRSSR